MSFPYEKRFRRFLQNDKLVIKVTESDTCHDVNDLFIYLRNFNDNYRKSADLSNLEESDIVEYLIMLQTKRNIKNTTYNKVLTHLNTYFKFLFKFKLSSALPTISLQGLERPKKELADIYGWQEDLSSYLTSSNLSNYTKMVLLLLAHFYTITEIVTPGFYQILKRLDWSKSEQRFITTFLQEERPKQQMQQCSDLFLKARLDLSEPRLSVAGLHKILKKDQTYCQLPLSPRRLRQAAIEAYLNEHQEKTDGQLCAILRLDQASLNYYRSLSVKNL